MHASTASRHGLIVAKDLRETGEDSRPYRREIERGVLVRVRRGVYIERERWDEMDRRARYLATLHAHAAVAHSLPIYCGETAAVVHDLPLLRPPSALHLVGRPSSGGRSDGDLRKHAMTLRAREIETIDGLAVTSPTRTALDIAAGNGFRDAVVVWDGLLHRTPSLADRLVAATLPPEPARAHRKIERVAAFASPLSESVGESVSRVTLHELRLPAPMLQQPFSDRSGLIGVVDFWWPEYRLIGEFDGRVKYTGRYGGTPEEAVWREKKREDRLRALGPSVTRWTWDVANDPPRLLALLSAAGLPVL